MVMMLTGGDGGHGGDGGRQRLQGAPMEVFTLLGEGEGKHRGLCDHGGGRAALRCYCRLPADEGGSA